MARFEGALARSSAACGLVPAAEAALISEVCASARFDARALALAAREAGTLAIPFVKELTRQVAARSASAARHVHAGGTSQDVLDTALVLCMRPAAARIGELARALGDALAGLVEAQARTPTSARTLLQPALPVPFGWKAAVWLSMLTRARRHFRQAADAACVLQFGGAGGTLSAFADDGDALAQALADELGLARADITWHSARDALARLGSEAAILAGAAAKIARDVTLLMQPEVGEAAEPAAAGRGGSSALPHKRNPALSLLALEAAQRAPGLAATLLVQLAPEHERGLGHWQSQWLTLRPLLGAAASALAAMVEVVHGLELHPEAMRRNLEASRGLVYAEAVSLRLARALGKGAAHALTERLCAAAGEQDRRLADVMRDDAEVKALLSEEEIVALFQPESCYGSAQPMMDRALAAWRTDRD